jgi:hypothetical protein
MLGSKWVAATLHGLRFPFDDLVGVKPGLRNLHLAAGTQMSRATPASGRRSTTSRPRCLYTVPGSPATGARRHILGHQTIPAPRAKKSPPPSLLRETGKYLAATYSHRTCRPNTIGAAAFHFRVRNGTGWFHHALATRGQPCLCRAGSLMVGAVSSHWPVVMGRQVPQAIARPLPAIGWWPMFTAL